MAELSTVINTIIGDASTDSGVLYYTNWSTGATAGAGAVHDITLNRKIEGYPPIFEETPSTSFPSVYIERLAWPSINSVQGKQYLCSFNLRIHFVDDTQVGETPNNYAIDMITKITENILASDRLNLDFVTAVKWNGFENKNDVISAVLMDHYEWAIASTLLTVESVVSF